MCSHDRQHIFSLNISLSPNFFGNLSHQIYLCPLLSIGQFITNLARGETALRTETEPIEGDISGSFVDSGDNRSLIFQHRRFGGYQTQNHLLAICHILQRLETTRTLIVILQIEGIYIFMSEEIRSYGIVGTLGGIAGMIKVRRRILFAKYSP